MLIICIETRKTVHICKILHQILKSFIQDIRFYACLLFIFIIDISEFFILYHSELFSACIQYRLISIYQTQSNESYYISR